MVSRDLEVVLHDLDVISVVNDQVDDQGALVVESDASHFIYGRISILIGSGNLVGIVLRSNGDKLLFCCRALHR